MDLLTSYLPGLAHAHETCICMCKESTPQTRVNGENGKSPEETYIDIFPQKDYRSMCLGCVECVGRIDQSVHTVNSDLHDSRVVDDFSLGAYFELKVAVKATRSSVEGSLSKRL